MRAEIEQSRDKMGIPRLKTVNIMANNIGIEIPMRFPVGTKFATDEYIVLTGNSIGKVTRVYYDEANHCMVIEVDIVE